jgi:hypothetical protein
MRRGVVNTLLTVCRPRVGTQTANDTHAMQRAGHSDPLAEARSQSDCALERFRWFGTGVT